MSIKKGEIYLANLGDKRSSDIGKIRPVVIFQNNFLNRMVSQTAFEDVVVLPLSSQIRQSDFSYFLASRDRLEKDSIILCNAIKMIDAKRLLIEKGVLSILSDEEIEGIENILYNLLGCSNKE
ncbi:MAG: type II toxin-antitoxin system PemK/MazF family toxin [Campylobacterota bacterium]|nr:type II toxin-antitoxin system PemK/MazF family toxin [Campylobacterota bacterium]